MIAGTIVGITETRNGLRLTIQEKERESDREVYPVSASKMLRVGDFVWSQCGAFYWTASDGTVKDFRLYMVRTDWDGYVWTLQEAMQGGRRLQAREEEEEGGRG